jgi:hypothetical protein
MECVGRITVFGRPNRGDRRRQRDPFGAAALLLRVKRFEDFHSGRGVTRRVLADRLKKLVRRGVLRPLPLGPSATSTSSPRGLEQCPIVVAIVRSSAWSMRAGNLSLRVQTLGLAASNRCPREMCMSVREQ